MSDDYEHIVKGPLRLKMKSGKKKQNKHNGPLGKDKVTMTKSEVEFKNRQEKLLNIRIIERAMKTHKQQVEEFNSHLDRVTEHFDIPKVSWTK